jgi:alkanesulfonate monooxygenase SsuD/methylene tetrahydromethanopterin reductase-like flavin-dependent oxidoreductase (luciferase family)
MRDARHLVGLTLARRFRQGGTQQEAGAFGYDLGDLPPMIEEAMRLIPRFWMEDVVEHHGTFIDVPARTVHPKPLQVPHPPLYMRVRTPTRSKTLGLAGSELLVLGFGGPDQVAEKNDLYRKSFANRRSGETVGAKPTEHLAALCPAIVLEDGAEARRIGLRGQRYFMEAIFRIGRATARCHCLMRPWPSDLTTSTADGTSVIDASIGSEQISVDFSDPALAMLNPNHVYGTVPDCIDYVSRIIDAGADEILFLRQMGTVPQAAQLATIRAIGEHVIPYFRRFQGAYKR